MSISTLLFFYCWLESVNLITYIDFSIGSKKANHELILRKQWCTVLLCFRESYQGIFSNIHSPVNMSFFPWLSSLLSDPTKSATPTIAKPTMTKNMPDHSLFDRTLCKKPTLNRPTKTITEPLNIWKLEAYVRFRPMYIMEVAVMSHMAGKNKMKGLKSLLPFVSSWTSSVPS